jgi:NAD(P)-dependent dehydrogenase (short-subunit alcohol dehydrogenase family)
MMTDKFSVRDKIAIVTGGLGQLGTQFSKSLAESGAKVAIFSRRAIDAADLEAKFPGLTKNIRVYVASVTDKASLEQATEQLIADWGVPHILVNNAGIDSKPSGSADQNSEDGRCQTRQHHQCRFDLRHRVAQSGALCVSRGT